MFKVGDKVKVVEDIDDSDVVLDQIGIIEELSSDRAYIYFKDGGCYDLWWVDYEALKLISYSKVYNKFLKGVIHV